MVELRQYQPEDAAGLIALMRKTIQRINSRDYSPEQVRAWCPDEREAERWPARVTDRFVIVAEEAGVPLGFGDIGPEGLIDRFFVHADHQRRGIGHALMTALLAEAERRGVDRVFSHVSISARPFFESHGFVVEREQVISVRGIEFVNYRMSRAMKN